MISADLLEILVCPETRQPLKVADAALIERLNAMIAKGALKNRGNEKVTDKLESGLVREDGKVLYAVRGDIPIMLVEEAIPLT